MFDYCRDLSTKQDQFISRRMGNMSIEEFASHYEHGAANPEELDALAFQLLCCGRRCKTAGFKPSAARWKKESVRIAASAAAARARVAAAPSRETHPGFWSNRSIGRPGCLDGDLFLPLVAKLDLGGPTMHVGGYVAELVDGMIYTITPTIEHAIAKAYFKPADGSPGSKVPAKTARHLMAMGRLVALPLSSITPARIAA